MGVVQIVSWVIYGDSDDVDEIDVDLDGVLLPDDYLLRLINVLSGLVNDDSSLHLSDCK